METTTTTLEDLGRAVARIQGDGIYLTGTGFATIIICLVALVLVVSIWGTAK